jgi:asparagine synthase (glutamine-hydrolysing)
MCGIVAVFGESEEGLLDGMLDRLRHRGPDGVGVLPAGRTWLGHRRLAILDLPGGAQPMTNERGDLCVAFNGEIYNHATLRRELESRHTFRSRSDTEVLLHLYEDRAEDMLTGLDGMFALALAGPNGLLLARDPLGIKPLYYGWRGALFLAASELKAFPEDAERLQMLPAGHFLLVEPGKPPRLERFEPPLPPAPRLVDAPEAEVKAEVRRRLDEAVRKRLMADVPIGVFLSGGLDSSLVAALMRPHTAELHSFAAGMPGAPDLAAARRVAEHLGTHHHELVYDADDVERALPTVIRHLESFDAPLVRSAVPMFFVSKLAAQFVKVVLTGEGADELFAGYAYLARFEGDALRDEQVQIVLRLQDTNLLRADRMTMAHGLEARVPFLDRALVRYVLGLPSELLAPRLGRPEKHLLREACADLLPEEILRRRKLKFSEGAGSSQVMAERLKARGDTPALEPEPGLVLRSEEEAHYFGLWRQAMGSSLPARLVGRTRDAAAAA